MTEINSCDECWLAKIDVISFFCYVYDGERR